MKYPQKQFEVLVNSLKKLAVHIDVKDSNPHAIFQDENENEISFNIN